MEKVAEMAVIGLNILTFSLMGIDKKSAGKKGRRIPERIIFALALIGGSAGVWLGMKAFRHKTMHSLFAFGVPLIVSVQVLLLLFATLR